LGQNGLEIVLISHPIKMFSYRVTDFTERTHAISTKGPRPQIGEAVARPPPLSFGQQSGSR
jgi:hypothetical protein